jgi:hypothetical protein
MSHVQKCGWSALVSQGAPLTEFLRFSFAAFFAAFFFSNAAAASATAAAAWVAQCVSFEDFDSEQPSAVPSVLCNVTNAMTEFMVSVADQAVPSAVPSVLRHHLW